MLEVLILYFFSIPRSYQRNMLYKLRTRFGGFASCRPVPQKLLGQIGAAWILDHLDGQRGLHLACPKSNSESRETVRISSNNAGKSYAVRTDSSSFWLVLRVVCSSGVPRLRFGGLIVALQILIHVTADPEARSYNGYSAGSTLAHSR